MRRFHALLIAAGLAAMPASAAAGPSTDSWSSPQIFEKYEFSTSRGRLGVMVMSLTPELRKHFGAAEDRGVLVAHVEPGTPAAAAGIAVGDVIVSVRGRAIGGAADVLTALADVPKDQNVAVDIVRDKQPLSLQATLANDASSRATDPAWIRMPQWLRDMMKPLVVPDETASPFEPGWFRELLHPSRPNETSLRSSRHTTRTRRMG
jgi:membrane-associated protease RseP (regulator of RpoE activity)